MPQLDFVSFHYIINVLSGSYLLAYVIVLLFLLKPIFKEFLVLHTFPTAIVLEVMLLRASCREKGLWLVTQTPGKKKKKGLQTPESMPLLPYGFLLLPLVALATSAKSSAFGLLIVMACICFVVILFWRD